MVCSTMIDTVIVMYYAGIIRKCPLCSGPMIQTFRDGKFSLFICAKYPCCTVEVHDGEEFVLPES